MPQMQGRRLPGTGILWLPRQTARAVWHAQAQRHGRQCCSCAWCALVCFIEAVHEHGASQHYFCGPVGAQLVP